MLARQGDHAGSFDAEQLGRHAPAGGCRPLYDLVVGTVLSSPKVFADDTRLPVLDPGRGRTKTGCLWAMRSTTVPGVDRPIRPWPTSTPRIARTCARPRIWPDSPACCRWTAMPASSGWPASAPTSRSAGILLGPHAAGLLRVPCLDEVAAGGRGAWSVVADLYAIEAEIRGHPAEQRQTCQTGPKSTDRRGAARLAATTFDRVSGASDLAKAMRYAIRHWPGLVAFLDDGRIEMDTNMVERAIRPHTLTRKNALFAGSDGGARHWAIAMTLIQTAKLNGVDPMAWLTDVLERVVSGRTKATNCTRCCPGIGPHQGNRKSHPWRHSRSRWPSATRQRKSQRRRHDAYSDLAKAMRYAIRHWPGLVAFLDDGRIEMDFEHGRAYYQTAYIDAQEFTLRG